MKTQKTILALIIMILGFTINATAQNFKADDLIGTWLTADGSGHIHIYKNAEKYYAKSTSAVDSQSDKTKKDVNNKDKSKRNNLLINVLILRDFEYDGDGEWEDGEIYDPANGKTYSCIIEMVNINSIEVTGYVGITLFGRTEKWRRITK